MTNLVFEMKELGVLNQCKMVCWMISWIKMVSQHGQAYVQMV